MRREYLLRLTINGRLTNKVLIDDHYELRHSNEINDGVIIDLIRLLNG